MHLFSDIFECCYDHRQISVKVKIRNNTQQKKLRNFCNYEKVLMKQQNFFVDLIENAYFPVDLAFNAV